MKKSCFVALGALMSVIGVANAASMKEVCLQNSDKFVWVEKNQDCVPINPCSQPETSNYYKLYCNDKLLDLESNVYVRKVATFTSNEHAVEEIGWYMKHVLNMPGGCKEVHTYTYIPRDPDYSYVPCMTGDGGFVEFKLPLFEGRGDNEVLSKFLMGQHFRCHVMGGMTDPDSDSNDAECVGVNEEQCNKIAEGLKSITYTSRAGRNPQVITLHPYNWSPVLPYSDGSGSYEVKNPCQIRGEY